VESCKGDVAKTWQLKGPKPVTRQPSSVKPKEGFSMSMSNVGPNSSPEHAVIADRLGVEPCRDVEMPPPRHKAAPLRLIRIRKVLDKTGLSRASIYRYINQGRFPRSVSLGTRNAAWVESEINAWIGRRIAERDLATSAARGPANV
jgi:prophage regulatory protein